MRRWILAWLPMIVIAFANVTLRELGYGKQMSQLMAQAVSTLTLEITLGVYIAWVIYRWRLDTAKEALQIGLLWSLLTVLFEFGLGWLTGHSWREMLQNYNVMTGRTWVSIPIWIMAAPFLVYRMTPRHRSAAYFYFSTASISISNSTSSPKSKPPLSKVSFQTMPKSFR